TDHRRCGASCRVPALHGGHGRSCLGRSPRPGPKERTTRYYRQLAMKGHKWFAAIYDRMAASEERRFMGEVRAELAGGARGKILEVGAGTGLNSPPYQDHLEVIASDAVQY